MITFDHVSKIYPGEFVALEDATFTIERGEFVSIVGQSGAGKSTLLKLIYAEEMPSEGTVSFNGRPLTEIKRRLLPFYRRNFGTVFQDFKLLPQKTLFENVAYALEVHGRPDEQINEEVPKMLAVVGLENQMDKYPQQISGGEAQRVSIARALIHRPKVLIADEPTGNLDPISTQEILDLLMKVNDFGTTVILATHDSSIVDAIHRRVILLQDGKIVTDQAKAKYSI